MSRPRAGVRVAKWLGDGLMVVAVEQADAVAFALDLERQASECCTPLSLRIGIASGYALLFEGDDYIGSAVNLASRLCDAAGPGEVLLPAEQLSDIPAGGRGRGRRQRQAARLRRAASTWSSCRASPPRPPTSTRASSGPAHRSRCDSAARQASPGAPSSTVPPSGMAPASDWRSWEAAGRLPPSGDGNGFATRYAEDLALLADHGLAAVRLTVDWARVMPAAGRLDAPGGGSTSGGCSTPPQGRRRRGVGRPPRARPAGLVPRRGRLRRRPGAGLVVALGRAGGRRSSATAWPGGSRCSSPCTWALDGYLRGVTPPGRRDPEVVRGDRARASTWPGATRGGSCAAEGRRWPPPTGSAACTSRTPPCRPGSQARLADDLLWGSWVSGLRDGILRVPGLADEEVADLAGSGDLAGHHLRTAPWPSTARASSAPTRPTNASPSRAGRPGPRGWPSPCGELADELPGRPVVVAGQGVGTADDELRADVLRESVEVVTAAVADGIDVRGWFHRSAIDGYEGVDGFRVPWGLFDRDRNAKPSALALTEAIADARSTADRRGSAPAAERGPAADGLLVEALRQVQALEHELDRRWPPPPATRRPG